MASPSSRASPRRARPPQCKRAPARGARAKRTGAGWRDVRLPRKLPFHVSTHSTRGPKSNERLRALPSVDAVLALPELAAVRAAHPRPRVLEAVRASLAAARHRLQREEGPPFD